jgi:hypothetical protein
MNADKIKDKRAMDRINRIYKIRSKYKNKTVVRVWCLV